MENERIESYMKDERRFLEILKEFSKGEIEKLSTEYSQGRPDKREEIREILKELYAKRIKEIEEGK